MGWTDSSAPKSPKSTHQPKLPITIATSRTKGPQLKDKLEELQNKFNDVNRQLDAKGNQIQKLKGKQEQLNSKVQEFNNSFNVIFEDLNKTRESFDTVEELQVSNPNDIPAKVEEMTQFHALVIKETIQSKTELSTARQKADKLQKTMLRLYTSLQKGSIEQEQLRQKQELIDAVKGELETVKSEITNLERAQHRKQRELDMKYDDIRKRQEDIDYWAERNIKLKSQLRDMGLNSASSDSD